MVPKDSKKSLDELTGISIFASKINSQLLEGIILGISNQKFNKKIEAHQEPSINNQGETMSQSICSNVPNDINNLMAGNTTKIMTRQ